VRIDEIEQQKYDRQDQIHRRTGKRDYAHFLAGGHGGIVAVRSGIYVHCSGSGEDKSQERARECDKQTYPPHFIFREKAVFPCHITVSYFMKHKT
jgi:hypothetical protein